MSCRPWHSFLPNRCKIQENPGKSVLVAAFTMCMAVGEFFLGRRAHGEDLDVELQIATGQRVIGVDHSLGQADLDHGNLTRALLGLDHCHHAGLPFSGALQMLDLDFLGGIGLDRAVGLVHRQLNSKAVASLAAFHGFYQAVEQAGLAVQVKHRFMIAGGFDLAVGVEQGVVELDNGIFGNLHGCDSSRVEKPPLSGASLRLPSHRVNQAESPSSSICSRGSCALTLTLPWAGNITRWSAATLIPSTSPRG